MNRVEAVMNAVDRADFLPRPRRHHAFLNRPIPIGYGQTNSQPSTVYQMLVWLDVHPGMKVLDVGSGSGWTTALLSHLVGKDGRVYAVELIPELLAFGARNCASYPLKNVEFHQAGDTFGLPIHAPYDRILVSAAADSLPTSLIEQLVLGGRMVVPVRNNIIELHRTSIDTYDSVTHRGFTFVPLIG